MIGQLKRALKRVAQHRRMMGTGNALYFLFNELTKNEKLKVITIAGEQVYVRTATTDIDVVQNFLVGQEYGNIKCSDPSVIIDAGANIGISAIYFAKKYPNSRIFAIEPEQGNYDVLEKNIMKFKNIVPIKAALWGEPGARTIRNRLTGHWGYTVSDTNNKTEATGQEIDCITIGSLLEKYNIGAVDILKIDIEGGEKNVLEASTGWIDKVKIITVELHDRICMGCDRAFYLATKDFDRFERNGEKITAYRR